MEALETALAAGYHIEEGTQLWHHDSHVDHEQKIIDIADDSGFLFQRSDENTAAPLHQALPDGLHGATGLLKLWGSFGRRTGWCAARVVGGGAAVAGGSALLLAREGVLAKIGGVGAISFGGSTVVYRAALSIRREGGVNPSRIEPSGLMGFRTSRSEVAESVRHRSNHTETDRHCCSWKS